MSKIDFIEQFKSNCGDIKFNIEHACKISNTEDIVTDKVIEDFSISHKTYINEQYKIYEKKNFELTICDAVYLYQNIFDNYINGFLRNDSNIIKIQNR